MQQNTRNVAVPSDLHKQVKIRAATVGITITDLVIAALNLYLKGKLK